MNIVEWQTSETGQIPPPEVYCPTPEHVRSRVEELARTLLANGWAPETMQHVNNACLKLLLSRFDRNDGAWRDVEGCWFQWKLSKTGHDVFIQIGDRGTTVLVSPTVDTGTLPRDIIDLGLEPEEKRFRDGLMELEGVTLTSLEYSSGECMAGGAPCEDEPEKPPLSSMQFRYGMKVYGVYVHFCVLREAPPKSQRQETPAR